MAQEARGIEMDMRDMYETNGFAQAHRRDILSAVGNGTTAYVLMKKGTSAHDEENDKKVNNELQACVTWWRERRDNQNNVTDLRTLIAPFSDPKGKSTLPLRRIVAAIYTAIYIENISSIQEMCGASTAPFRWWDDTHAMAQSVPETEKQQLCEFKRACSASRDNQDSERRGNYPLPIYSVFAAALTVAVVTFALFTSTVSWVGLPSYNPPGGQTPDGQKLGSALRASSAQLALLRMRGNTVFAPASALVKMLTPQANRFLLRIQRAITFYVSQRDDDDAAVPPLVRYVCGSLFGPHAEPQGEPQGESQGEPHAEPHAEPSWDEPSWDESGAYRLGLVRNDHGLDSGAPQERAAFLAFLVHWCAEEGAKCKCGNTSKKRVSVCVYVGAALLMSATHGKEKVVLARTTHKTDTSTGLSRNETVLVQPNDASELTRLLDEAMVAGRLTFVASSPCDVSMPLHYKKDKTDKKRAISSADDILDIAREAFFASRYRTPL